MQTGQASEPTVDGGQGLQVTHLMLRVEARPAIDAGDDRVARDAEQLREVAMHRGDELCVCLLKHFWIPGATQEPSKEYVSFGSPSGPF